MEPTQNPVYAFKKQAQCVYVQGKAFDLAASWSYFMNGLGKTPAYSSKKRMVRRDQQAFVGEGQN